MAKKRVLYIFSSSNYSGAEIVIARLITFNKDQVDAIVLSPKGVINDFLTNQGIKNIPIEKFKNLQRASQEINKLQKIIVAIQNFYFLNITILKTVRQQKIEVVHGNNMMASFYALPSLIISKLLGWKIKWIWSDHDINYLMDGQFGKRISNFLVKKYDLTLAVSNAVKISHHDQNKIKVLYNGMDLTTFKEDPKLRESFRTRFNWQKSDIVIGMLGTISSYKGQDILIEAFKEIFQKTEYHLKLVIVGKVEDATFFEFCKESLKSVHESSYFISSPGIEVPEIYNGIDLVVNATKKYRAEPLGTTLLEGMCMGKICIASNTGGSTEIIKNKENGYIFEADSSEQLANVLLEVISNQNGWNLLKQNATETIKKTFEISQMAANYNDLI